MPSGSFGGRGDHPAEWLQRGRRVAGRPFGILSGGEVSEWLMVPLSKSGLRKQRGFESHPLRHGSPAEGGRGKRATLNTVRARGEVA